MRDINILNQGLEELNIELSDEQINQFLTYYELLIEYNKVMNLTSITEYDEVVVKHFLDSLSLIKSIDLSQELEVIDVGTGAGFPGIPLKIAFPHLKIVLLDSLNKRVKFLNEVIHKLKLQGIVAIHSRAEDLAKNSLYREKFDLCVSRAVANLSTLSEYCMPFVKVNGYFISYKAGNMNDEMLVSTKAINIFGGIIKQVDKFILPNTDIERTLVVIHKLNITPKLYPRNAGKPSKEPILTKL